MAKEPPNVVKLSGRKGFNQEMCGEYYLGKNKWQGKVFYVNRRNHWVIRWESRKGLWIVDWRGLKNDTTSAAFVRQNVEHPGLITKKWKVYTGDKFQIDPDVQVDIVEEKKEVTSNSSSRRGRSSTAGSRRRKVSLSREEDSSSWNSDTSEYGFQGIQHRAKISKSRIPYSKKDPSKANSYQNSTTTPKESSALHVAGHQEENVLEPVREDVAENHLDNDVFGGGRMDNSSVAPSFKSSYSRPSKKAALDTLQEDVVQEPAEKETPQAPDPNGGGWLDEHGFAVSDDFTIEHQDSIRRTQKWRTMLYGRKGTLTNDSEEERMQQRLEFWERKLLKHPKLKTRIRKGIPGEFRSEVWVHITGARKIRLKHPKIYSQYVANLEPGPYEQQIWKDIKRSYRGHDVYKNVDSPAQQKLYRVLTIYSKHHDEVGYNQGISFVAAMLLIYLDEEDAFWTLHVLTASSKFAMGGVWAENMPQISLRFYQMECLCRRHCPLLGKTLDELAITADMYQATQWFVTVFLATDLPFGVILRIWDIYLHEGLKFIFRIGLILLEGIQRKLHGTKNPEDDIWEFLQSISEKIDESMIERAVKLRIRTRDLENLKKDFSAL